MLLVVISCTGSLTTEERKKMRENMEQREIKKVTEAQILEAAMKAGRDLSTRIEKQDKTLSNPAFLDSLSRAHQIEIVSLQTGNKQLRAIEAQILEAYLAASGGENIQMMGTDSLIYTKPIWRERPDGSTEFLKAIGIRMTRKQVIISIQE